MYLAGFADGFGNIVGSCAAAEVDGDGMRTSGDVDDGRGFGEQRSVLREVGHTQCRGHDDKT